MKKPTRRRLLTALALTGAAAALPELARAGLTFGRKNIREFGEIYDYLKDGYLRVEKTGKQRITIKNADFPGEEFRKTSWGYFDFVDCYFTSNYDIRLDWLTNCTFTNCRFQGIFGLGQVIDVRFLRCKVIGKSGETHLSSDWKSRNLVFEDCEFSNADSDPNHISSAGSAGESAFIACKGRNFAWEGNKKLTLKNCTTVNGSLDTASPGLFSDESQMPYSDFLLEDCDFTGGADMTNAKLNSFTMRRCKLRDFRLAGAVIRNNALIEGIKEGYLRAAAEFQGKLVIRNCSFSGTDGQKNSFEVSGDVPTHTLLENITCGRNPVDVIRQVEPIEKWDDPPPNKSFLIRNCKIPHLKADWAQTEHLRLENCEIGQLDIRDGRIGRLEIRNTKFARLDLSRTAAAAYAIDASGEIIDTDSNHGKTTGSGKP